MEPDDSSPGVASTSMEPDVSPGVASISMEQSCLPQEGVSAPVEEDTVENAINVFIYSSDLVALTELTVYNIHAFLSDMINEFKEWQTGPQGGGNMVVTAEHNKNM